MIKTIPKLFKCSLMKRTVTIEDTYQDAGGTGDGGTHCELVKRRCLHEQQCAQSGSYRDCPLKVVPPE